MQPFGTLKGFGVTFKHIFRKPITEQYPEYKRPVYPRFRGRHRLTRPRQRARKVRRLLTLRRRVPVGLHPRRRRGEHGGEPRLGRRAVRPHLRDQPEALHLLRLLRARLPLRRDHARKRVRALGVLARRPDLHQGHAPRRADQAGSRCRTPTSTTPRSPPTSAIPVVMWARKQAAMGERPRLGRLVPRRGRVHRLRDRRDHVLEPVLLGSRADREPRLAGGALPARLGRVPRGRPGARLRGRGDGHVPLRDRLPRRPRRGALGGRRASCSDGLGDRRRDRPARRGDRRDRDGGGRPPLRRAGGHQGVRQPRGDRAPVPDRPPARVRDHVDRPPRRRRRRRRARDRARGPRTTWTKRRPRAGACRRPLVPRRRGDPLLDRHRRRAPAPQPADRAALARDHAQRREPRPDLVRAAARQPGRPDLRARGDGGRRLRGRRRPRPDRRDRQAAARPRRRPAPGAQG